MQEQSGSRPAEQTPADQRHLRRSDVAKTVRRRGLRGRENGRRPRHQQQDEEGEKSGEDAGHHRVRLPGLLATLFSMVSMRVLRFKLVKYRVWRL